MIHTLPPTTITQQPEEDSLPSSIKRNKIIRKIEEIHIWHEAPVAITQNTAVLLEEDNIVSPLSAAIEQMTTKAPFVSQPSNQSRVASLLLPISKASSNGDKKSMNRRFKKNETFISKNSNK